MKISWERCRGCRDGWSCCTWDEPEGTWVTQAMMTGGTRVMKTPLIGSGRVEDREPGLCSRAWLQKRGLKMP